MDPGLSRRRLKTRWKNAPCSQASLYPQGLYPVLCGAVPCSLLRQYSRPRNTNSYARKERDLRVVPPATAKDFFSVTPGRTSYSDTFFSTQRDSPQIFFRPTAGTARRKTSVRAARVFRQLPARTLSRSLGKLCLGPIFRQQHWPQRYDRTQIYPQ